jgi:hypothetical protein
MGIFINGMSANTPEEKRKAIESQGGKCNELIKGDYVQIEGNKIKIEDNPVIITDGIYNDVTINMGDDDGNQTPGTGNYTENIQGSHIHIGSRYLISHGGYELFWNQQGNSNRYAGEIEVKGEEYELKAIFDYDESKFVCYIPGIVDMGNGIDVHSLTDVKIVEWAVIAIQENF